MTIKDLTGDREVSADALREYYRPLEGWLARENEKNGEKVL